MQRAQMPPFSGLCGAGGGASRCRASHSVRARKASVVMPTIALIARSDISVKTSPPTRMPSSAPGISTRISRLSHLPHQARRPETSIAHSSGSAMPAAIGAGTLSDIIGTSRLPAPEAKPPLLMPGEQHGRDGEGVEPGIGDQGQGGMTLDGSACMPHRHRIAHPGRHAMDHLTDPFWLLGLAAAMAATGLVSGTLAGLLGVGGGIVIVPLLFNVFPLFGIPEAIQMKVAVATSLATIIPTSIQSARKHHATGTMDVALLRSIWPAMLAGVAFGTFIGVYVKGRGADRGLRHGRAAGGAEHGLHRRRLQNRRQRARRARRARRLASASGRSAR